MKIRNGFISNSSTTTFVMVAAEVEHFDMKEAAAKLGLKFNDEWGADDYFLSGNNDLTLMADDYHEYLGKILMSISSDDYGNEGIHTFSKAEIDKVFAEVEASLVKLGIREKPRVVMGDVSS